MLFASLCLFKFFKQCYTEIPHFRWWKSLLPGRQGSYTKYSHLAVNHLLQSQSEKDWWGLAVWNGEDSRNNLGVVCAALGLYKTMSSLGAQVTGDHEVLRALAGVRSAGTKVHEHHICAKCRATKGKVLEGEPIVQWKEQLDPTDLLPGVAVDLRVECPLHRTRIVVSQLLNYTCSQMRESGGTPETVAELKKSLAFPV